MRTSGLLRSRVCKAEGQERVKVDAAGPRILGINECGEVYVAALKRERNDGWPKLKGEMGCDLEG
jgi:hypothetical protein